VLWRLIKASAIVAVAGLALAGCAVQPLKMGAAAIVGSNRISVATLGNQANNLSQTAARYPGVVTLTQTEVTQATLTWLIRYQIQEELARQAGIYVSPAQANAALQSAVTSEGAADEQEGLTNPSQDLVLALLGIPPGTSTELGRYVAISDMYLTVVNGGKVPATGSSALTAAENKLTKATCQAAKTLNIQVNPQYGVLDYSELAVVTAPSSVTRPAGPAASASPIPTTPAC
jgi:hypothetical protein